MCSCPAKGRTKKDRLEGPTLPTKFKLLEVKRSPATEPAAHCLVSGDQSSRGCTGAPSPYPAAFFPRGRFPAQGPLVVFLPSPRARRAVGTAPQAWGTGAGFHLGPACANGCDGPPGAGSTAPSRLAVCPVGRALRGTAAPRAPRPRGLRSPEKAPARSLRTVRPHTGSRLWLCAVAVTGNLRVPCERSARPSLPPGPAAHPRAAGEDQEGGSRASPEGCERPGARRTLSD